MYPFPNLLFALLSLIAHMSSHHAYPTPMNCTDASRLCTSFLAFKREPNQTLSLLQSMFDVSPSDITVEDPTKIEYVFIKKNCSCLFSTKKYVTNTTFTLKTDDGFVSDIVDGAYDGLAMVPNTTRRARIGGVVSLRLLCGCSSKLWNYLMSYVLKDGDSVQSLSSRFGVSMDDIETVNGISNPDNVTVGDLYFIPLNSGFFLVPSVIRFFRLIYMAIHTL